MEIIKKQENNRLTIKLVGRLDTNTAPELDVEIKALDDGINDLVFDCVELEYVSSAGLRVLLLTQKLMDNKGSFKLINVADCVKEVFEITGFDEILKFE